jgi:hypothetical protein
VKTAVEKMEAQLGLWCGKIDKLATEAQMARVPAGFDTVMYIDELKALCAIAQSKLHEFRAAGFAEQELLTPGMKSAWGELQAAIKNPSHRRKWSRTESEADR